MSKAVHQLVHTLSYGDAISGEVFALQRALRQAGASSDIYAINVNPRFKGSAFPYRDLPADFDGEVVLHYSLGSPLNEVYRGLRRARRSLVYHNLTPPDWFAGVNPRIVADIRAGQAELPQLCALSDRLLADSSFNAGELARLGFKAEVLELPLDRHKWDVPPNAGIAEMLRSQPLLHLVHVGRLAPNKCVEDIIKVFYFLHHYVNNASRLWLVGIDIDTELYSFGLKRLVLELKLEQAVTFTGCMADSELKALYQGASAYLCMSEHEGFCLPLVEAMSFGLPVVAFAATAVPDTVGKGGVLVQRKKHAEIAELLQQIHVDHELRQRIINAGYERARELDLDRFDARVQEVFFSAREAGAATLSAASQAR